MQSIMRELTGDETWTAKKYIRKKTKEEVCNGFLDPSTEGWKDVFQSPAKLLPPLAALAENILNWSLDEHCFIRKKCVEYARDHPEEHLVYPTDVMTLAKRPNLPGTVPKDRNVNMDAMIWWTKARHAHIWAKPVLHHKEVGKSKLSKVGSVHILQMNSEPPHTVSGERNNQPCKAEAICEAVTKDLAYAIRGQNTIRTTRNSIENKNVTVKASGAAVAPFSDMEVHSAIRGIGTGMKREQRPMKKR